MFVSASTHAPLSFIDRATIATDYKIMEENTFVVVAVSPSPTFVVDDNNHDYNTTVINVTSTHDAPSTYYRSSYYCY